MSRDEEINREKAFQVLLCRKRILENVLCQQEWELSQTEAWGEGQQLMRKMNETNQALEKISEQIGAV